MIKHSVCMTLHNDAKMYLKFYDLSDKPCTKQSVSDACKRIARAKCGQIFAVSIIEPGREFDNRLGFFSKKTFTQVKAIDVMTMTIDESRIDYRVKSVEYDVVGSI